MKTIFLLYFLYLSKIINSQIIIKEEYKCKENENNYPDIIDDNCFHTPARNDIIGNNIERHQDINYLVGYIQQKYSNDKNYCRLIFITKINKQLGVLDKNYKIIYKFGNIEQENNTILFTSNNSYPDGLSVSCIIIDINNKNIIAKLELENIFFLWDNIKISQDDKYENGQKGVIVELFGWPYDDIAEECEFLGRAGYLGVKIFFPNEAILSSDFTENGEINPWWYLYQPVSYKLNSRFGDRAQLKNMINKCRLNNIRIYSDIVINNMVSYDNYKNTNYTNLKHVLEFPSVPYCGTDFHCFKDIKNCNDENQLNTGWVNNLIDLNTGKNYVQQRIADFITDLLSIGISGIFIYNAKYISPNDYTEIFKKLKNNLGFEFPEDFIAVLEFDFTDNKNMLICGNGNYSFSGPFKEKLTKGGLSTNDISKIKIWNSNFPDESPKCDGIWKINPERHVIGLESLEGHNDNSNNENYINYKNIAIHRNKTINLLKSNEYNWKIKSIFSSYSKINNANGFPDGKSDCSKYKIKGCTKSVPYQKAYSPFSTGYDTGNLENWKEGTYSRVHRDLHIINSMREWMGLNVLTKDSLYKNERKLLSECPEEKPFQIIETGICIEDYNLTDFFNNIYIIKNENNTKIFENIIRNIEKQIIDKSIDNLLEKVINIQKDYIFQNDNILIQITSSYNQKYRIYNNISTIELEQCENYLKDIYHIKDDMPLIIVKVEYYEKSLLIPIIEYEIFHPTEKIPLNLKYCNNSEISINIPVNIDENNLNIYNTTSNFYTDKCNPYTSKYATDINLEDRKYEFIYNNLSLCENNCKFEEYDTTSKKVLCTCKAKNVFEYNINPGIKFDKNNILDSFINIRYTSNLHVMKCYKILFTKDGFIKNVGNFLIISIILLYIFLIDYFSIRGFNSYKNKIYSLLDIQIENNNNKLDENIIKDALNNDNNNIGKSDDNIVIEGKAETNNEKVIRNINIMNDNSININPNNSNINDHDISKYSENKINNFKITETKNFDDKIFLNQINLDNSNKKSLFNNRYYTKINNPSKKKKKKKKIKIKRKKGTDLGENIILSNASSRVNNLLIYSKHNDMNSTTSKFSNKNELVFKKEPKEKFSDYELNHLSYNKALEIDKRTYFQYYVSLLKTKHLFFFTFFNNNDYNSKIVKICIFLFSFVIFLTINALFFTNSIIHKIYENKGKYNLKSRLPNIIYSTIISTVIYYLIKYAYSSEKNIIKFKNEKNIETLESKILVIFKYLIIKFTFFFDISLLFLFLFWYYISCFCAVYNNTQSFIIKDTFISFIFSFLYQSIISIIPGFFRIYSLRNTSKNNECLYKASKFFQIL